MAKYFRITEIDAATFEHMTGDELDCLEVVIQADDGNVYAAVDEELKDSIEVYLDLFDGEGGVLTMDVREKLVELLDTNCGYVDEVEAEVLADHLIANGVTVVVRCKDCKYFETPLCENEDNYDNWFCADGERKENK